LAHEKRWKEWLMRIAVRIVDFSGPRGGGERERKQYNLPKHKAVRDTPQGAVKLTRRIIRG
jgi:hypothetical protein